MDVHGNCVNLVALNGNFAQLLSNSLEKAITISGEEWRGTLKR